MGESTCRACGGRSGQLVLDLGEQPPCDYFPARGDPGPDPVYPLQMWMCDSCGLAQLVSSPVLPEEPRGVEPAALVSQAAAAVEKVAASGWLTGRRWVAEYGSPHGGSWLNLLGDHGLMVVRDSGLVDLVVDCFGMMHAPDQAEALADRVGRVAPGGVLLLQYHSLATILRLAQWNSLRHGHYAYFSSTALIGMLAACGFKPLTAWSFDLYGGTVLLAAGRAADGHGGPDAEVQALLEEERRVGITVPGVVGGLQRAVAGEATRLHDWLVAERAGGRTVLGYGAASRAVAVLCEAGIDRRLLPAVADVSVAKQGRRMPGTDVAIIGPAELVAQRPDAVLLLLPDLLDEVRAALPEVEAYGGRWVVL